MCPLWKVLEDYESTPGGLCVHSWRLMEDYASTPGECWRTKCPLLLEYMSRVKSLFAEIVRTEMGLVGENFFQRSFFLNKALFQLFGKSTMCFHTWWAFWVMVSASSCVFEVSSRIEVDEQIIVGDFFTTSNNGDWGGTGVGGGYMNGS